MPKISIDVVKTYFDVPIAVAAECLGVDVHALKRVCRRAGYERWPFRHRESMSKFLRTVKSLVRDRDLVEDFERYVHWSRRTQLSIPRRLAVIRQMVFKMTSELSRRTSHEQYVTLRESTRARMAAGIRQFLAYAARHTPEYKNESLARPDEIPDINWENYVPDDDAIESVHFDYFDHTF